MFRLQKKRDVILRASPNGLIAFDFSSLATMIFRNTIEGRKNFGPEGGRERTRNMGFIDLHKPLMDLIPDDYKLCIDRDFGYTILTLRHGDRTQCCRIRSDEEPTDKNLKAAIIFMVEQMKREE